MTFLGAIDIVMNVGESPRPARRDSTQSVGLSGGV